MIVNKAMAQQIENCIAATHLGVAKITPNGTFLEINGGIACFSGVDAFLSQVVAWGFHTEMNQFKLEIDRIESFYKSVGNQRVDIELCPHVGKHLALALCNRGYTVCELNNVSYLDLNSYSYPECATPLMTLRKINPDELKDWSSRVAIGFGVPEAQDQFAQYVQAEGVEAFAVFDGHHIVAGATISIQNRVCDLGVTSTIPIYRGKGLQKALLHARLNYAKLKGVELATVTTEPGTVSDANIQKIGFHCAYTRIKFSKKL